MLDRPRSRIACVSIAVLGVVLLAWIQPIDGTRSDGAIALVAAQALVEHGTFDLNVYRDDPRLIYDLDSDYRIFSNLDNEALRYYSFGVPLVSAPAVWLANRAGWNMLDPASESALQNLLSALCCGLVLALLYRLARCFLAPAPSLALALVFQLGSPLISTLATGLWSFAYSIPLMIAALIAVVSSEAPPDGAVFTRRNGALAGFALFCLFLAVLCRSASALILPGLGLYTLERVGLPRRWVAGLAIGGIGGLVILDKLPFFVFPTYYAPQRLFGAHDALDGVPNLLLTPSRGLLVFCPFLVPLIVMLWMHRRRVFRRALAWLCLSWIALEVIAVGTKGTWWGGNSFGPRLLTEVLLAAFLLALLLFEKPLPGRRRWLAAGAILALPAIAIHSGQALFNPAVHRFNEHPVVDDAVASLYFWRTPQFLADHEMLVRREIDWQWRHLEPLPPSTPLLPDSNSGVFEHFWRPESSHRWSMGETARVCFDPRDILWRQRYILDLRLSVVEPQRVSVYLDDDRIGAFDLIAGPTLAVGAVVEGRRLDAPGARCLTLEASAPHRAGDHDPRTIGVAFRSLTIAYPPHLPRIASDQQNAFIAGWSFAEPGYRWTMGTEARIVIGTDTLSRARPWRLVLRGFGLGNQRLTVRTADGRRIGDIVVSPTRHTDYRFSLEPTDDPIIELILELPDARIPGNGDPRRLAFALETAWIEVDPIEPGPIESAR